MSPSPTRLELRIDVFEKKYQRALALADLKPADLVAAVIGEFVELEYLEDAPEHYRLVKAADGAPLDEDAPLGAQLANGDRLILQEAPRSLPEGTRRPTEPIYLREMGAGKTFGVAWLPAIIGRTSENMPQNDRVAVDLKSFAAALRVSRRHAILTEEGGKYFIQNVSSNPVSVIPASLVCEQREGAIPVQSGKFQLYPGDIIRLERSDIALKFVIRDDRQAAPADDASTASGGEQP
jgi:hypothetical protein